VAILFVLVLGVVYVWPSNTQAPALPARALLLADSDLPTQAQNTEPSPIVMPDIIVHITGAVYEAGVYSLPYGSRVNDVLQLAGGATAEADLTRINLAAFLLDAQQVIIPLEGEELPLPQQQEHHHQEVSTTNDSGLLNVNTATVQQLTALPGIGAVIAGNIVNHREANGPFTTIEDLQRVPRIGAVTVENIRSLITVE